MNNACFYHQGKLIDYAHFNNDISQVRSTIVENSCQKILLFQPDSYQFSVLLFALLLENKHILLPPNCQPGTIEQLAQQCDATAGNITISHKPSIAFTVDDVGIQKAEDLVNSAIKPIDCSSRDVFLNNLFDHINAKITFYTSGTTGNSKAIVKTWQQLNNELSTLAETFKQLIFDGKFVVSTVSHQHIYGLLFKILLPLRAGKVIVSKTFEYPEHITHHLSSLIFNKASSCQNKLLLISSPAHLTRLVLDNVLIPFANYYSGVFSSGGLLPRDTSLLFAEQMKVTPIEVYGSTETGGVAWRYGQLETETPWHVFSDITFDVCSDDNQRLVIYSPYMNEQPYLTDDKIVKINAQQFLLKGRIDRTLKVEEKRINLDHLEQHLLQHSWVNEVRVLAVPSNSISQRRVLASAVKLTEQGTLQLEILGKRVFAEQLKKHLLTDFERVCLPKKWRYLDKFPYNLQGKLVLRDLERLFE